jgi:3-methylcrotonyl-CoA carboxylase alpha subunit
VAAIRRLLIANRGEIAVRVIRACREMHIETALVTGPGDAASVPAALADAVVPVTSYLDPEAVVAAALAAGADAVHPGYGFLSEDPAFAERVIGAGLTWVGPPPDAMRRLGDKIAARTLAETAGLPVVPGYGGPDMSDATLANEAARMGTPLLVKASAGGGGRGMRAVTDLESLPAAVDAARAEALAAFDDDRIFLERRMDGVRHVEVQILLDAHGNGVHLGERDCSLQRRHQKIVEESPSPAVDAELRASLGDAALAVAREAGYVGAGTVEFLLGADGAWWFLEMNARLQVEHPVTEMLTGIDLVRGQLAIAAGAPLALAQADVQARGHVIEARVYAEDPVNGFLPSGGRVERLDLPRWPGVRIDTALATGDDVGLGYDPLLAKVIAIDETRAACLARLCAALAEVHIVGVTTNLGFLLDALSHPDVAAGAVDTDWVETRWRPTVPALPEGVRPAAAGDDAWTVFGAGQPVPGVTVAGRHAQFRGWAYVLTEDELAPVAVPPPGGSLTAPMPAGVTRVDVEVGQACAEGAIAVMLEAMKLQIAVSVPVAGTVRAVHVQVGDVVATGQVLIEVDPT